MRILISFLINLCCVFATIHAAGIYDCPSRIQRLRPLHVYANSCLLYVRSEKSWEDARRNCRSMGGDLVTIKDADKQTYLLNSMRADHWSADNVWIGATDQKREGHWEWIDGTKVTFNKFADGQGTNHNTGFFFANGSPEDCAVLRRDDGGKWHDYPCSPVFGIGYKYTFICEFRNIQHNSYTTTTSSPSPQTTISPRPQTTQQTVQPTTQSPSPQVKTTVNKETPAPTTTLPNVETPAPTTLPNVETPAPTTLPNVETPAPTTLPNVETPAPTTLPNVETPAPTTLPNVETPAPTTLPNVETPAPTTLPNVETPAPTTLPNVETPAPTDMTVLIGKRKR